MERVPSSLGMDTFCEVWEFSHVGRDPLAMGIACSYRKLIAYYLFYFKLCGYMHTVTSHCHHHYCAFQNLSNAA